jgi:hypothetical protein
MNIGILGAGRIGATTAEACPISSDRSSEWTQPDTVGVLLAHRLIIT